MLGNMIAGSSRFLPSAAGLKGRNSAGSGESDNRPQLFRFRLSGRPFFEPSPKPLAPARQAGRKPKREHQKTAELQAERQDQGLVKLQIRRCESISEAKPSVLHFARLWRSAV
jgi:hypothetical protein